MQTREREFRGQLIQLKKFEENMGDRVAEVILNAASNTASSSLSGNVATAWLVSLLGRFERVFGDFWCSDVRLLIGGRRGKN